MWWHWLTLAAVAIGSGTTFLLIEAAVRRRQAKRVPVARPSNAA